MIQLVRIASVAMAAALVMSCSSTETSTSNSASCAGDAPGFWSGAGRSEVVQSDLAYLATFEGCAGFGSFGTAEELAAYVAGGSAPGAAAGYALCAQWFAFALNARHGRFVCGDVDVLFDLGDSRLTLGDVEGAVRTALALGDGAALTAFFADANGGAAVCVCATGATGATGGTGGTGATGSWGE